MKTKQQRSALSLIVLSFVTLTAASCTQARADEEKIPVIIDTDIGSAIDDAFALGLALASPELEIRGITTVGGSAEDRAWLVCRLLTHLDRRDILVGFGRAPQPDYGLDWEIQYRRHPAVVWNRTVKPAKESAVELLFQQLKADPGNVTIVALGPLTNIAELLEKHPDAKPWIKRIVFSGGSFRVGYNRMKPAVAEWNVRSDVKAVRTVIESGVPLVFVPLDATAGLELNQDQLDRVFAAHTPLSYQLQALYQLWEGDSPVLFDALAVALSADERLCKTEGAPVTVDEQGITRAGAGTATTRIALKTRDGFLDWCVDRIAKYGEPNLPKPPKNIASFVDRGGLPTRVHVFEDYETDIEKRWWMTGKLETKDVPIGSRRACRSVLTQDFDAKMGDTSTTYSAVVFNPVPGPPMGKHTRLAFRYKLHGTDRLRVQLFSLSNGYHRYLSLKDVPQDEWRSAAVDMTEMRRPDGSGGPLSEDERIDDIQFYVDPRAEVLIDDVVLYDAAPADETRPFPKRLVFTGWFDTGQQGREWPGDFEIVPHEKPRTWDAAKSVVNADTGQPWLRVYFRGRRPIGELTRARFQYRLSTAGKLRVVLADTKTGWSSEAVVEKPAVAKWAEAVLDFDTTSQKPEDQSRFADEIRFYPSADAELLIDDLLVYEPTPAATP